MPNQENSFVQLGDDQENAPVLKYSIPEPNSYFFRNIIPLDVPEDYFKPAKLNTGNRSTESETANTTVVERTDARTNIYTEEDMYNQMKFEHAIREGWITVDENGIVTGGPGPSVGPRPTPDYYEMFLNNGVGQTGVDPSRPWWGFLSLSTQSQETSAKELIRKSGSQLQYLEGIYEINGVRVAPSKNTTVKPQLLIIESYQLSNYRGDYGAGGVIKTHSLAPGEKNKFSVKTYQKTTEVKNEGSSILDSNTRQAASDFEESFEREQSSKYSTLEADLKTSERGEVSASASFLGIGASAGGSYQKAGQWGTRSTRDDFAKTVGKAVAKHSYRASSKRNVEVNFSSESTTEEGVETSLEREVENINVSRTLNLVFRQMMQEFVSVLHLLDIKLAVYDGTSGPYPEYSFYEFDSLLDEYFVDDREKKNEVKVKILRELYYIFDHEGTAVQFLEKVTNFDIPDDAPEELGFEGPIEYWRVKKPLATEIKDLPDGVKIPGIVIDVNKITMRTEGVIMDAFLGLGEGLDNYSKGLQDEAVRERALENDRQQKALDIIDALNDNEKTEAYEKMFMEKKSCHVIELKENPEN